MRKSGPWDNRMGKIQWRASSLCSSLTVVPLRCNICGENSLVTKLRNGSVRVVKNDKNLWSLTLFKRPDLPSADPTLCACQRAQCAAICKLSICLICISWRYGIQCNCWLQIVTVQIYPGAFTVATTELLWSNLTQSVRATRHTELII